MTVHNLFTSIPARYAAGDSAVDAAPEHRRNRRPSGRRGCQLIRRGFFALGLQINDLGNAIWQQKDPKRFKKRVYNLTGLDS